jgi:hypothetical protein
MAITFGKSEITIPQKALCVHLDAGNPASYPGADGGGTTWYDLSGLNNNFKVDARAYNPSGVKYMDFTGQYGLAKSANPNDVGIVGKEQGNATIIVWTRILNNTTNWRTLIRGATSTSDHHIICGGPSTPGWLIGMYDNQNGSGFNSTGYSQQSLPNYGTSNWVMMIFRFGSSAPTLRLSLNDTPGTIVGSNNSNNAAFKYGFNSLGGYGNNNANANPLDGGQYWGDIAWFACWNRQLTDAECLQVYNATSPRFHGTTQQYQGKVTYQDSTDQVNTGGLSRGEIISITSYASPGTFTWTKPEGCTKITVKVTGGGGGAAGYCESGGGGGYAEKEIDATNLTTVSVTVGSGGNSVGYYTGAGNGGTSSFGSYVSASGGYGANQNYSHSGGAGGVGSGGQINLYGGGGTGHANSHGYYPGGTGGGSFWGGSSAVRRDTTSNKLYTGAWGSGGPGGRTDDGGGGSTAYGENGIVVVYAYK